MRAPIDETTKLRQELADAAAQVERQCSVIYDLLRNIGEYGGCSGCGKGIVWVIHRNGRRAPYDPSGVIHFCTSLKASQFRKQKQGGLSGDN